MSERENVRSDKARYLAHFKKCYSENPFMLIFVPMREYGFFILPFAAAYLCFYFAVFDASSLENDIRIMCIIIGTCLVIVTVAAIFLRKIIRIRRFYKLSGEPTPLFSGNRWNCPCCRAENKLLAPCVRCGIYPQLYKSNTEKPDKIHYEKRTKKVQKQFDEYKPQFKEN